jgi:hypothetical protein
MLLIFRIVCAINGLAMAGLGVYGLVEPLPAVRWMAGIDARFDPSMVSLIHMHVATDLGLGLGFLLVAYRPAASLPAFVLCAMANFSHGMVHVLEEIGGRHEPEHSLAIVALVVVSVVLAALYPWKDGVRHYLAEPK